LAKSYLRNKNMRASSLMTPAVKSYRPEGTDRLLAAVSPAKIFSGGGIIAAVLMTVFVIAACKPSYASWEAGLPGVIFRLPAGAWASGMGGAVSAEPEYMLSWYNPAQLPFLRDRRASAGAGIRPLGRPEAWASYDFRVPPRVGMGLSFVYRGDPFLNGLYDGYYTGSEVSEEHKLKAAAWTALSLKVGAGYLVSRRWSAGGSIAVEYQSLPTAPAPDGSILATTITSIGALDIAAAYKVTPGLTLSASVKNLLARNDWTIRSYGDYSPAIEEVVPPVFTLSSTHKAKLLDKELVWGADAEVYLIDGNGEYLGNPQVLIAAGAKWMFTDDIVLRAGLADIGLSGDIVWDRSGYWGAFSPRLTAGFSYSLSKWMKGAFVNYALMTDRVWAGVDQQFDITVSF